MTVIASPTFEKLDRALVPLGGGTARECPEIAPPAGFRIFLARIEPKLARRELADHAAIASSSLLRPLEQPAVDRLSKDMSLHRFHDVRACLERIRRWLHVELGVERVDFEHVVMLRTGRRRARSSIHRAGRADLIAAVWPL